MGGSKVQNLHYPLSGCFPRIKCGFGIFLNISLRHSNTKEMTDFDDSNSFLVKVLSATPQKTKNSPPIVRILKDKIILFRNSMTNGVHKPVS